MPELLTLDCLQPGLGKLERVKYFNRMLLTADDMRTDQDFVLQKLRRHNRFLHGWGVVCGLMVKPAPTAELPWRVQIGEGYALGPFGDEIFVGEPVFMDLAKCGPGSVTNPCEPSLMLEATPAAGPLIFVAIKYAECRSRPVKALPGGCGCEDDGCEYSRIRDSFSIECLSELPPSHQPDPDAPTLCEIANGKKLLACLPCPTDPWVVLAKVTMPASNRTALAETGIDNKPPIRRLVFSTALIQQQVIDCCCGERDGHEPPPPPPQRLARLEVVKRAGELERSGPDRQFGSVRFEITVTNHGPDAATNVIVRDDLGGIDPGVIERLDFMPAAPWTDQDLVGGLEASLGQMAANATVTLIIQVTFRIREVPDRVLKNTARVKSDTPLDAQSVLHSTATVRIEVR
jgi:Domain of unknown function DUF11